MKNIINDIWASFNNHELGMSARKATAFSLMICIFYLHLKFVDSVNVIEVMILDLCGVALMLGIVTIEQIIKFKNGENN